MKILILSDIEASGEWLSQQSFVIYLKSMRKDYKFDLVAYGKSRLLLKKNVFNRIFIIKKPISNRPLKYYKELLFEFLSAVKIIRKVGWSDDIGMIIGTDYMLLLASFFVFPFKRRIFFFQGFRHFYKLSSYSYNHYMIARKFFERLSFFLSTKLIVPSIFAEEIIKKELGAFAFFKSFFLIPNLCRPQFSKEYSHHELQLFRKKYHFDTNIKYIVYGGVIEKRKSLYELIEGFSSLVKSGKNIKLVIAYLTTKMETQYFDEIKTLIVKKKLKRYVLLLKDLGPLNLSKLFQISAVGILPSKLEMDSVFIKEALECSLPIIASKTGGANELLGHLSPDLLLRDCSSESIFNSLSRFIDQPDEKIQHLRKKIKKQLYFIHKKTIDSLNQYFL